MTSQKIKKLSHVAKSAKKLRMSRPLFVVCSTNQNGIEIIWFLFPPGWYDIWCISCVALESCWFKCLNGNVIFSTGRGNTLSMNVPYRDIYCFCLFVSLVFVALFENTIDFMRQVLNWVVSIKPYLAQSRYRSVSLGQFLMYYLLRSPTSTVDSLLTQVLNIESMHHFGVVFLLVQVHSGLRAFGFGE